MAEHSNRYDPRLVFNDDLSHFQRMDKGDVESYFSQSGPLARVDSAPNWAERVEGGKYELVTLDGNNEVTHRWGIFITMKAKQVVKYEEGKGKAVATWDYTIVSPAPEENRAFQFYSDDSLKYVFAYPGGLASAVPPRMRQLHRQISTLRFKVKDGEMPFMPYVNLVFFMWLEDDEAEGHPTFSWLIENMGGWRDSYQA